MRYLSNPLHKAKVRNNSAQDGLTGLVLYHPKFCLIVVEGGAKGLKHFKNLMMKRIDWTEESLARNADAAEGGDDNEEKTGTTEVDADGEAINGVAEPQSLADNTCTLVWEGTHRERMFRPAGKGGLRQADCPTDAAAKEFLGPRFEGMWDVAKKESENDD